MTLVYCSVSFVDCLVSYQNLYKSNETWRPTTNFEEVASLSEEDKLMLLRAFGEEVKAMIHSCAADKGSGLDGFTTTFFQKSWDFIKREIIGTLNHFHQEYHLVQS